MLLNDSKFCKSVNGSHLTLKLKFIFLSAIYNISSYGIKQYIYLYLCRCKLTLNNMIIIAKCRNY